MTRSLSNLIKARFVYVDGNDKKVIDSNGKVEEIQTIHMAKPLTDISNEHKLSNETSSDETFTEGLKATVITQTLSDKDLQTIQEQGIQIISDAKEQAAQILEQAKLDAEIYSQKSYDDAQKRGYEDGLQKGKLELNQAKKELEDLTQMQNSDYLQKVDMLEPQIANVLSELIEKITGILVQDKKDVISYLVHNAMQKIDNSKSYAIRTSKEDYEYVLSQKDELYSLLGGDITIDISFDGSLNKNQCLIETDTRIIDCSLDVQLKNLIQDIKLLSLQKE